MAQGLLRGWNAPSVVTTVDLDASSNRINAQENTRVQGLKLDGQGGLTWTQDDAALPFPLDLDDATMKLVLDSSDFVPMMDSQTLRVAGLPASRTYTLSIEPVKGGTPFTTKLTGEQLARGVELARMKTPMWAQSREVLRLVVAHTDVHQTRWRNVDFPYLNEKNGTKERDAAAKALDRYEGKLYEAARKAAQPGSWRYRLTP